MGMPAEARQILETALPEAIRVLWQLAASDKRSTALRAIEALERHLHDPCAIAATLERGTGEAAVLHLDALRWCEARRAALMPTDTKQKY